jgi:tight adherence protein B
MSSAALGAMSLGLLMAAAGLGLWFWARTRQSRQVVGRHLDRRLAPEALEPADWEDSVPPLEPGAPAAVDRPARAGRRAASRPAMMRWPDKLAGWLISPGQLGVLSPRGLLGLVALVLGGTAAVAIAADAVAASAACVLLVLGAVFFVWLRMQQRRRTLVRQLPGFLDSLVRLINIGNSTHAAFQISIPAVKAPLRVYLDDVNALVKAGVELEPALLQVARGMRVDALLLLAAIMGLGVRYGGRADLLLERMAHFLRDREQAERELVAMSSETRMSAWVLGLMPAVVGTAIIMLNAAYFIRMWDDPSGRQMLYGALALQLTGAFLLYRLARLA